MKCAFVSGANGQVGSYLVETLLASNYEVHGLIRRNATISTSNLDGVYGNPNLHLHYGDVCDPLHLSKLLWKIGPDEIYHLAAASHVRYSFDVPIAAVEVTGMGTLHLLEVCRDLAVGARIFVMCSSEMFGNEPAPQDENTPFSPRSPYAAAKAFSYHVASMYRAAYGMDIRCGIVFNTESPRRDPRFVTRKITQGLARICYGLQNELVLGNMQARRDWMYVEDCVRGIYAIMQHSLADDFVLGTGETHSVREFYELALSVIPVRPDVDYKLVTDTRYNRPLEVDCLQANPAKARSLLAWQSRTSFEDLIRRMCQHDLTLAQQEAARAKK